MNNSVYCISEELVTKHPELTEVKQNIEEAFCIISKSFREGGKLLVCGNGGSAADAEHIIGELMKGFLSKRKISNAEKVRLSELYPGGSGDLIADRLQGALPAISLVSQTALLTAYGNDIDFDMIFAQQVYGYGRSGDVLLGLTTSGSSANVVNAVKVAKVYGLKTIGMTGRNGGLMKELCDITIRVPADSTPAIQEFHLPIYHALCAMLEAEFFK